MIVIVDYNMGNLGSIRNMFLRIEVDALISSNPTVISKAQKLILPGVGAFDTAMSRVNSSGLREILDRKTLVEQTPILGICLGMQLLTRSSEEGKLPGLGWINAETRRFPASLNLKVPHMGWNLVIPATKHSLTENLPDEPRFYFVHSYYVQTVNPEDSILKTTYGITFDSAIAHKNICGVQFHPEKSHKYGMMLLSNFARL